MVKPHNVITNDHIRKLWLSITVRTFLLFIKEKSVSGSANAIFVIKAL